MKPLKSRHTAAGFLFPATLMLSLAAGCGDSGPRDVELSASEASLESSWVPAEAPTGIAYLRIGERDEVRALRYSEVDGLAVFEGDIILGKVSALSGRPGGVQAQGVAISDVGRRWPYAIVPYTIAADLTKTWRVTNAIAHWQEQTQGHVQFVPRTNDNAYAYPNYVTFRSGTGCSATVGMAGGQQFVNLATGCSTGNTIHEIGHALGLFHEQAREDRDYYVSVLWENVQGGREHNFYQRVDDGDDLAWYDYDSIMHYDAYAFSSNGLPTIEVLTPGAVIGQRVGLSYGDIETIFTMYP
jgi:astacin